MLVEFKVKNFKSIKDDMVFSMETGYNVKKTVKTPFNAFEVQKDLKLLKSSLIFGPNASGKSNFLEALWGLRTIVVSPPHQITKPLSYQPYKSGVIDLPTEYDITFFYDEQLYHYAISFTDQAIHHEKLEIDDVVIWDRRLLDLPELRDNQTLIDYYQGKNQKAAASVLKWFETDVVFLDKYQYNRKSRNELFELLASSEKKKQFLTILQHADFNIVDVQIVEQPPRRYMQEYLDTIESDDERNRFLESTKTMNLQFIHQSKEASDFLVSLEQESAGTQKAVILILALLAHQGKIILLDEFDDSFHLSLSTMFLSLINSEFQYSQFILTSHEISLMDHNMRNDQIYFMSKNKFGESEIISLFDYKTELKRNDAKYSKKYLQGRYGAVPNIDVDEILEVMRPNQEV